MIMITITIFTIMFIILGQPPQFGRILVTETFSSPCLASNLAKTNSQDLGKQFVRWLFPIKKAFFPLFQQGFFVKMPRTGEICTFETELWSSTRQL